MSANTTAAAPAKSKKMLLIILGVVAVLVVGGGVAAWLAMSRSHGDEEDGGAPARREAPKAAPTILAMENMVVNLADPGGDRFAQIGITLEVDDDKTAEQIKQYLPAIRSGVLMLVSQRTSSELLQREGKEKLAADVLREVSRPLGYSVPSERARGQERARDRDADEDEDEAPRRRAARNPVRRVLFSSFIIQ